MSPKILFDIYQQQNHSLPEVKALTSERLKKCRSRINQAVRDGCLEQYLADFTEAVKKAQQTPFLRGEGARGWRASFDWFVANHVNIYGVLEGKYDGPAVNPNKGGVDGNATSYGNGAAGRTSRGDPIYIPANEPVCSLCGGTGWRRAGDADSVWYRRCECVKARIIAARLQTIPALFRGATFESYLARNQKQEQAATLMKSRPEGSWYLTGPYGSGKTHLLYAQYHEMAVAGRTRCHVRTTRELVEELKKMEMGSGTVSPVMAAALSARRTTFLGRHG